MANDIINYPKFLNEAMQDVVKKALTVVAKSGLPETNHFLISFFTFHPKVTLSKKLRNRYPQEMTIVLQHQFQKLEVKDDYFSVYLFFDGVKEKVVVPYDTITHFSDPGVSFGLQLKHLIEEEEDMLQEFILADEDEGEVLILENDDNGENSNVISLELFRKNKT